ncbi:MAG: hypothetical protein K0Q75_2543 [Anaerospora sp.]|nr:hypothetical protein [Anaerospora sp.]
MKTSFSPAAGSKITIPSSTRSNKCHQRIPYALFSSFLLIAGSITIYADTTKKYTIQINLLQSLANNKVTITQKRLSSNA